MRSQSSRDRWLEEGLAVLADKGVAGVRIESISRRLGLTKGSFHHHFDGIEDYHRALLERHAHEHTCALTQLAEELGELPSSQALQALPRRAKELLDVDRERAVRSWAVFDPAARLVQEHLDRTRLDFLEGLWNREVADPHLAHTAALLPFLVTVGAGFTFPPLREDDLGEVFDLLLELAPGVSALDPSNRLQD